MGSTLKRVPVTVRMVRLELIMMFILNPQQMFQEHVCRDQGQAVVVVVKKGAITRTGEIVLGGLKGGTNVTLGERKSGVGKGTDTTETATEVGMTAGKGISVATDDKGAEQNVTVRAATDPTSEKLPRQMVEIAETLVAILTGDLEHSEGAAGSAPRRPEKKTPTHSKRRGRIGHLRERGQYLATTPGKDTTPRESRGNLSGTDGSTSTTRARTTPSRTMTRSLLAEGNGPPRSYPSPPSMVRTKVMTLALQRGLT